VGIAGLDAAAAEKGRRKEADIFVTAVRRGKGKPGKTAAVEGEKRRPVLFRAYRHRS
jgi:hypothetical protein